MIAQSVLMLAVAVLGIARVQEFEPTVWSLLLAIALFIASAWTGIAGVVALGRNRTAYPKPLDSSRLVRSGIRATISRACW